MLVWALLGGAAVAQATSALQVVLPVVLQTSGATPATLGIGPLSGAGTLLQTGFNLNLSQLRIEPVAVPTWSGAIGWRIYSDIRTTTAGPGPGTASISGRLELTCTLPQQRSGVLILTGQWWTSSLNGANGDVTIDVDRDGSPDYFAGNGLHTEIPLVVGPQGTSIWIDLGLGVTTPWIGGTTIGGAYRIWEILFVPDGYGVEKFASGCIGGFSWWRQASDLSLQLSILDPNAPGPGPTIFGAWLLLGVAPAAAPLPFPPNCLQMVQMPSLLAPDAYSSPWTKHWALPEVVLPPGLQAYAQVVWMRNDLSVFATDALRTF